MARFNKCLKMTPAQDINMELDISRELAVHQEISGNTKELTEFDATPPMYVTSLGRGLWPKPDPREIRLPRAFYENKGLLSSRAQQLTTQGPKRSIGRGSILSKYGSSRPGHAPSSMTDGTATTPRDVLMTPVDLEEGKAALMRRFLGTQGDSNEKAMYAPGEGSLVFSLRSGSVKTLPDVRCKEDFPSLLDDDIRVPVKVHSSHSDVGLYKKPSQKSRKASTRGDKQQAEDPEILGEDETPAASGQSFTFKDLAKEINNSPGDGSATRRIGKGRGRGRGRKMKELNDDFLGAGDLVGQDDGGNLQGDTLTDLFQAANVLQVEGLPADITQEEVVDLFALFGTVLGCHIMRDAHTRHSIGMAQLR
ncbi:uncharacterized protein [Amphiura filiformis]|uniref:uncharacterized protein n=1 Tax=Amphiura filiformis TaxID=82378 RepID=UPI003B220402